LAEEQGKAGESQGKEGDPELLLRAQPEMMPVQMSSAACSLHQSGT